MDIIISIVVGGFGLCSGLFVQIGLRFLYFLGIIKQTRLLCILMILFAVNVLSVNSNEIEPSQDYKIYELAQQTILREPRGIVLEVMLLRKQINDLRARVAALEAKP